MLKALREEIDSVFGRDPAVRSRIEVVLCYPGFHAILFFRLSHWLWCKGFRLLGRFVSHVGRVLTGIEIHPGATIGKRFFIDHGMGVVIGETAEVGDDVTLYHGVTLGGTTWQKGKRHPTLGNDVVAGAGAKILGPITVGDGALVGANSVVVRDVPPGVSVVGIPGRAVDHDRHAKQEAEAHHFAAYGVSAQDMPDPVSKAINGLLNHVSVLEARIKEIEATRVDAMADVSESDDGQPVDKRQGL